MKAEYIKKLFSILFLSIFFIKMLICAAPLIIAHIDSKAVNAVIMQLEIEDNTEKFPEKVKEALLKEYCINQYEFSFSNPLLYLSTIAQTAEDDKHVQSFYPPVPTPPPSV